ncbi:hypothetical protein [Maliponia aquimaris]|uniref:Uncharacterized protein n=1 Tax=Maliponia aquimaris TaxID=1673631 RepID=A0A238L6I1_9RHOB|nr:hypothetical protein [Maliponia aquimaris]SMX50609.1 hypothetical protein MAA8898_04880 [Maliponia aquimaris]
MGTRLGARFPAIDQARFSRLPGDRSAFARHLADRLRLSVHKELARRAVDLASD